MALFNPSTDQVEHLQGEVVRGLEGLDQDLKGPEGLELADPEDLEDMADLEELVDWDQVDDMQAEAGGAAG